MKNAVVVVDGNQVIMNHATFDHFISFDITSSEGLKKANGKTIRKLFPKGQLAFKTLFGRNTNKISAIVYLDGDIPYFYEKGLTQYLQETGLFQRIVFMKREKEKFASLEEEMKAYQERNMEER